MCSKFIALYLTWNMPLDMSSVYNIGHALRGMYQRPLTRPSLTSFWSVIDRGLFRIFILISSTTFSIRSLQRSSRSKRLKPKLADVISKEQFGFLGNREILKAAGITQECLHSIKMKKLDALILKMDLSKHMIGLIRFFWG